jgi:chaperonin GroES
MCCSELSALGRARTLVTSVGSMNTQIWSLMNVTPLHDRLIVHRIDEGEQTVGGIIVPDNAKEKPQRGTVLAVGLGKIKEDGSRQPPDVKNGDTVLFGKYSGQEIKIDGEDYLIMREDDVLAIIDSK